MDCRRESSSCTDVKKMKKISRSAGCKTEKCDELPCALDERSGARKASSCLRSTSCQPQQNKKNYLEALVRMGQVNKNSNDAEMYQKQLSYNEQVRNQIRIQKSISAGTVLETQSIQQKVQFQDHEMEDLKKKICEVNTHSEQLRNEIDCLNAAFQKNQSCRCCEIKQLQQQLDILLCEEESVKNLPHCNAQASLRDLSILETFFESDIKQMNIELHELQLENLRKTLSVELLKDQKKLLEHEMKHLEEREAVYECQLTKLVRSIRSDEAEIKKYEVKLQSQENEICMLQEAISDVNKCIQKAECQETRLLQVLEEKKCAQKQLQLELDQQKDTNKCLKEQILSIKNQLLEMKKLIMQDQLFQEDVFQMRC